MSDPVKRDPILDQFSMITRPYTRLNGLKTIPFPCLACIANIWEYSPPPPSPGAGFRAASRAMVWLFDLNIVKPRLQVPPFSPCKQTQQITTLLVQQCWELLVLVVWCMQTNATPANIVGGCLKKRCILVQ